MLSMGYQQPPLIGGGAPIHSGVTSRYGSNRGLQGFGSTTNAPNDAQGDGGNGVRVGVSNDGVQGQGSYGGIDWNLNWSFGGGDRSAEFSNGNQSQTNRTQTGNPQSNYFDKIPDGAKIGAAVLVTAAVLRWVL